MEVSLASLSFCVAAAGFSSEPVGLKSESPPSSSSSSVFDSIGSVTVCVDLGAK